MSTPQRRRSKDSPATDEGVKVWASCGGSIQIAPFNSVNFQFGFSKTSPSESRPDIMKTERQVYSECERIFDKRVRSLARVARQIMQDEGVWEQDDEWDDILDDDDEV